MTVGEDDYPPPAPRGRRPLSDRPDPDSLGWPTADIPSTYYEDLAADDQHDPNRPWIDPESEGMRDMREHGERITGQIPAYDDPAAGMSRPRMPGAPMPQNIRFRPGPTATGPVPRTTPQPAPPANPGPRSRLPVIGAVIALLAAAGLIGWMFTRSGGSQEITIGGTETSGAESSAQTAEAQADLPPLSPSPLPAANEAGLVGLEVALIDPYTGTGSTGTVELYLNSLTGQVCHLFDAAAISGRYRAYIHEAEFPREGPIVVDLGDVENSVSRCVNSSPIDLARALTNTEGFYVAAHSPDRLIVLRAQLSDATTAFDNRDPALVATQEAAQAGGDGSGDGLFGSAEDGAYLVVESGRVTFEGMVPDEDTAQLLRSAFVALSGMGVDVIDNLMVQAGAPAPSGKVIVADALLFDSGEDQIAGDSPVLSTIADLMIVNPTWTMTITGHTDDTGDYLYNIELSLRRANNIRTRLADLGVPPERIRVQGAGPEQPITENTSDDGRARNRRIEISIDS